MNITSVVSLVQFDNIIVDIERIKELFGAGAVGTVRLAEDGNLIGSDFILNKFFGRRSHRHASGTAVAVLARSRCSCVEEGDAVNKGSARGGKKGRRRKAQREREERVCELHCLRASGCT